MVANRLWMIGCIGFAALSIYLVVDRAVMSFSQYTQGVRDRMVTAQRDAMFVLVAQVRPALQADQIEAAANAAKLSIKREPGSLRLMTGVEFILANNEVTNVRSINFQ
jgi:hypothetical protein